MEKLSNAKILGGIGSVLLLIGFILSLITGILGLIAGIIGLILVLMAVKNISEIFRDESVFKNYLIHFLLVIGAFLVIVIIIIATIGMSLFSTSELEEISSELESAENLEDLDEEQTEDLMAELMTILGACCIAFIIGLIIAIISALFLKKSFDGIAKLTKVNLFKTTGIVFLIGVITSFLLFGGIIILIAYILQIVAFFSLPDDLPATELKSGSYGTGIKSELQRRCTNCGRIIPKDSKFCPYCGKKY